MTGYVQPLPLWLCLAGFATDGTDKLNLEQQAQVTYLSGGGHNAHTMVPMSSRTLMEDRPQHSMAQGHRILINNSSQGTVTGPPAIVTGKLGSGTAKAHKGVTPEPAQCSLDGHRGDETPRNTFTFMFYKYQTSKNEYLHK